MDAVRITLDGKSYEITREQVILAMHDKEPGTIRTYAVEVEGRRFPVKQVLAEALDISPTAFISTRAQTTLNRLGFRVWDVTREVAPGPVSGDRERRERALALAVELVGSGNARDAGKVLAVADEFDRWLAGT